MRIAFDLDNTFIRCGHDFLLEKPRHPLLAALLGVERLRAGIVELHQHLRSRSCEIWVYTTSYRSSWHIRRLFWQYGLRLDGIVNQQRHNREVTVRSTKYPPQFGIDWLIDDSEGVRLEGQRHGFRVWVVAPEDKQWVQKIKDILLALDAK